MNRLKTTLTNMHIVLCSLLIVLGMLSMIAISVGIKPFIMVSESMSPEVPKNSFVLIDTHARIDDVEEGQNVAYLLGKFEAMHKVVAKREDKIVVRSLVDGQETIVGKDMFLGKEILTIPSLGEWIYKILKHTWIVIVVAVGFIVWGCIPE